MRELPQGNRLGEGRGVARMSRNVTSTRRVPGANSRVLLGATTTAITVPRYPESIRPSITWCPGLASAGA